MLLTQKYIRITILNKGLSFIVGQIFTIILRQELFVWTQTQVQEHGG